MTSVDTRPNIQNPDDDPYLWLEEIQGERAVNWAEEQSKVSLDALRSHSFDRDRDALAAILDRTDKIPYVSRRDGMLYNFWKDAENIHGLWRRTTQESYGSETPEWETLLDIDALSKSEGQDWAFSGASTSPFDKNRAIIRLSPGGGDAVELREFDLQNKCFVDGGFHLPVAKSSMHWWNADTLIVNSAAGEGMATQSGYARTVRKWVRGTPFDQAEILFETATENMAVWGVVDRTIKPQRLWFIEFLDFVRINCWLSNSDGSPTKLNLPEKCWSDFEGNLAALSPRENWTVGGKPYPAGSVLISPIASLIDGDTEATPVFVPTERVSSQGHFWNHDELIISVLNNLKPELRIYSNVDGNWQERLVDGIPEVATIYASRLDASEEATGTDLVINCETPLTPPQLLLLESGNAPIVWKQAPKTFLDDGLLVTRHEAKSDDGTLVPYFQVGPENPKPNAPVHIYGYGGFQVSEAPHYRSAIGKLWLEQGGTSVVANIRGGGEFGPQWHQAGIRENKHKSHDDFAAVARDLVERGVTVPNRIAAEGGSNGGILITNMLTRYPDLFGALFCTIPLIDMRRYTKLLAGASWIAEYGDPDVADDWEFLREISAYHNVEAGQDYPPIFIATTRLDDRVHPGHARKMAAKLQTMGYDAAYYEANAGGHSYGKDSKEQSTFTTLGLSFLKNRIGWETGDEA